MALPEIFNAATYFVDRNVAEGRGDDVAIECGEERVTYGELYGRACGAGARLQELGVEPGARVLLVMDDCAGLPAAFLGAIRIGAVPVPVNPLYTPDEYAYFVSDSGATVAARSVADNRARAQLINSAGLAQDEAAGLSLTEIAAAKFDRDTQN